ncbi:SBBP repeat-containing protein [Syntrophobacter fumaroxidans]|uniref:Fibronectin, type III n=1 Tax=Syntrophobacter fumaroxidans (strain DSM 10017 / MPOB) TaxID=335543 RepID=A0LHA0_SYNFM|nr:SBBP repeat-containing protein [Syntrophobacter fumaroxidans]ABK16802.1 fibronectin, type III [Syntrophobacter fumaroxidans MPOB]
MKTPVNFPRLPRTIQIVVPLLFFSILSCPAVASAGWVQRYGGGGGDFATGIAVDRGGNVYVTGASAGFISGNYTYIDYATIKYDRYGNRKWVRRYNGPKNYNDEAAAIAVDPDGNVYVTGKSMGLSSGYDYATVKYDTNGKRQWVRRYNGPQNKNDKAMALAVDGGGNVYVTGRVDGDDYGHFATIKYDTNGKRQWVRHYKGPWNAKTPAAIAVDGIGNVYVSGAADPGTFDYVTIKYDADGGLKWERHYNGPGGLYDMPAAMAVDRSGNVYVTGGSMGSEDYGSLDYATIKYDTEGNEKWVRRYNGPRNENDTSKAIAVDSAGNVYVTGEAEGIYSSLDYTTIKYDADGNRQWIKRLLGPRDAVEVPTAIGVDSAGNVYVTGQVEGASGYWRYGTVKYDTDGNRQWVKFYSGGGTSVATAMVVTAGGNVYVTGISYGAYSTDADYVTIKYDTNGN